MTTIEPDAMELMARVRADAVRARRLLDRPVPASVAHRGRAAASLARASERLSRALDGGRVAPPLARRLVDIRDSIDAHLLAAGEGDDDLLATHQHRLLVRAAELVVARADAALIRRAG